MADSDQGPERLDRGDGGHPILVGLAALAGVGLVVGLILGGVVLFGLNVLGLGGDDTAGEATGKQSLYVPKPVKTSDTSGPDYTLSPGESESATDEAEESESASPSKSAKPEKEITLSASTTQASPMQQVDLSGLYPGGEGAILQVQRMTGGQWLDFPVTVSVSGGQFQTYVQTSQTGDNRFRVVDTDSERKSNVVTVTIG